MFPKEDYDAVKLPPLESGKRRTLPRGFMCVHLPTVAINVLFPPMLFCYVTSMLTFSTHFKHPRGIYILLSLGLIPVIAAYLSVCSAKSKGHDARWASLSFGLLAIAYLSGFVCGDVNYGAYIKEYYFVNSLKTYSNVNPAEVTGAQLMDAGVVHFKGSARLEKDMGMSYTTWDTFCVAPIATDTTGIGSGATTSYDLWAVGMNCCRTDNPFFACGDWADPAARGGLRQVSEKQRRYYRLAVEQAEAAYNIKSDHPIFFHWVKDPELRQSRMFMTGFQIYIMANMMHFVVNVALCQAFMVMFTQAPKAAAEVLGQRAL